MPMDNRLMTRESEWVTYFIDNTEHIVAKMEQMKREYRPVLGGGGTAENQPAYLAGVSE